MTVGILGSGFGLYGYLPAIVVGCGQKVLLPEKYRSRLLGRADIAQFVDEVQWMDDEGAILNCATALIITRRPSDQLDLVTDCLARTNIKRLLLEKPMAPDPASAASLLHRISASGRIVRIGYTFRYTPWAKELLLTQEHCRLSTPIEIRWLFSAHHHRTNTSTWKRKVSMGGGAVRFFGIHLIALLAEMGYSNASTSELSCNLPDEADSWQATFVGPMLPEFRVAVVTNAQYESFSICYNGMSIRLHDPFQAPSSSVKFDRRITSLTELCADFLYGQEKSMPWYKASIELWSNVESHEIDAGTGASKC